LERCTSIENGRGKLDIAVPEKVACTTTNVLMRNALGWSLAQLFNVGSVNYTSVKTVWSMLAASADCQSVMSMSLDWILAILHMSNIVNKHHKQSNFLMECDLGAKGVIP
jgi:hypothetical protein